MSWKGFAIAQSNLFSCYHVLQVVMSETKHHLCRVQPAAPGCQPTVFSAVGHRVSASSVLLSGIRPSLQRGLGGLREVFPVFRPQITFLLKPANSMRFFTNERAVLHDLLGAIF